MKSNRKEVLEVLAEMYHHQLNANLGGIIGGKEEEKMAKQDLAKYQRVLEYAKKNLK